MHLTLKNSYNFIILYFFINLVLVNPLSAQDRKIDYLTEYKPYEVPKKSYVDKKYTIDTWKRSRFTYSLIKENDA